VINRGAILSRARPSRAAPAAARCCEQSAAPRPS
jgi:hypothetical protein